MLAERGQLSAVLIRVCEFLRSTHRVGRSHPGCCPHDITVQLCALCPLTSYHFHEWEFHWEPFVKSPVPWQMMICFGYYLYILINLFSSAGYLETVSSLATLVIFIFFITNQLLNLCNQFIPEVNDLMSLVSGGLLAMDFSGFKHFFKQHIAFDHNKFCSSLISTNLIIFLFN